MNRFEAPTPPSQSPVTETGTGYLIVRVTTARGAIPLENATVNIRTALAPSESQVDVSPAPDGTSAPVPTDKGNLIVAHRTDRDGLTPRTALTAPRIALSQSPGNANPYAVYDIDVALDGYLSRYFQNVPIFDTITSLQTVDLIPLPEGERPETGQMPPAEFFRETQNPFL